jgi:serine/threonine protein kinase
VGGATRAANMLEHVEGGHTLRHLIAHFGGALDARHVAWIWKRLLEGLDWVHRQGFVHAGITPDHVLVFPYNHGAKILDWSYAVKSGGTLKAISSAHRALYPAEVLAKKPVTPGADLHMVARCMEACFAGARGGQVMPRLFRGLIDACTLPAAHRYQDAFEVREELKKHLRMLFGPPKFVEMRL